MQRTRVSSTEENVDIFIPLVSKIRHNGIELFNLCHEFRIVCWSITAKFRENINGLGAATIGNQPSAISFIQTSSWQKKERKEKSSHRVQQKKKSKLTLEIPVTAAS